jgi:hypothetical protein
MIPGLGPRSGGVNVTPAADAEAGGAEVEEPDLSHLSALDQWLTRVLSKYLTPSVRRWLAEFSLLVIIPLAVGVPVLALVDDAVFKSRLTRERSVDLMLAFILLSAGTVVFSAVMAFTVEPRAPPGMKLSLELIRERRELDEAFATHKNIPFREIGEYPWWSLGYGLVTQGIRRVSFDGTQLKNGPSLVAFLLFFCAPLVFLPPIISLVPESIGSRGVAALTCIVLGLPSLWVAFHGECTGREVWEGALGGVGAERRPATRALFPMSARTSCAGPAEPHGSRPPPVRATPPPPPVYPPPRPALPCAHA